MRDSIYYSIMFSLVGMLFVGFSIPLILSRVPPNRFYGFRTPKTLSDEKIWYEANRLSGYDLLLAGLIITISSVAMVFVGRDWNSGFVIFTLLAVMVFSLTGALWHGYEILKQLQRDAE